MGAMEPKVEDVREIKKIQKTRQAWFKLLTRYCEHVGEDNGLCHIPVSVNPEPGVMACHLENCYLSKEDEHEAR